MIPRPVIAALLPLLCVAASVPVSIDPASASVKSLSVVAPPSGVIPLTLAWDPPVTNQAPSGYRVYIGRFSQTYSSTVDVAPANTTLTLTNLSGDQKYYFNITSIYGTNESMPAGEIFAWSYTTNPPALQPPADFGYAATNWYMLQQSFDLTNWSVVIPWTPATNKAMFWRTVFKTQ